MPTRTIHTLLAGLLDYAGLFPPADLAMAAAVAEYARLRRSPDAWILGRFVLPAERLDEFEQAARDVLPRSRSVRRWPLAALVGENHEAAKDRIDAFNRAHLAPPAGRPIPGRAAVEAVELKPSGAEEIARAARAFDRGLEVFYELSYKTDPGPLMAAIAAYGGRAKIRTGGVTAHVFPSAAQVSRFVRAAERTGVPFKATAGLHHPLPGKYKLTSQRSSPKADMHGFVNLVLAAGWIATEGMDEEEVLALLSDGSPKAITFSDDEVRWRDRRLSSGKLEVTRRRFALACGSCSIAEPLRDLRSLKLL